MRNKILPFLTAACLGSTSLLALDPAQAEEPSKASGGFAEQLESLSSSARAKHEITTVEAAFAAPGSGGGITLKAAPGAAPGAAVGNPGTNGAAFNPDTDPAFQRAMRTALANNDDSLFFNPKHLDAAKNRTVYSLQDPCHEETGAALNRCRTRNECTTDAGSSGVSMDVVVGRSDEDGKAARGTQLCITEAQAEAEEAGEDGTIPLPVFTLADFKQLNVAPAQAHAEPTPDTLKNFHTNLYATPTAQTFTTTLAGYPVTVRAYPAQYHWNYGDGTTLGPTPLTGSPLPDGAWDQPTDTSHVFTTTGTKNITLTTYYYGEYNIAGTGWQPVAGYNDVTSPPLELTVWKSTVRNVAEDCNENPTGWGCPHAPRPDLKHNTANR